MERTETSSLHADLRIRLEGAGEVLESAVARLRRLEARLSAGLPALDRDDVGEFKAALAALPAVDEALEKADRLDGAHALAAEVRRARELVQARIATALASLGHPAPQGGFAEHLRALLAALKHLGRLPGPRERALFEGQGTSGWGPIVTIEALALAFGLFGYAAVSVPLGVAALLIFLAVKKPRIRWWLLPDRVLVERPGAPLLEVQYEEITAVSRTAGTVELEADGVTLALPTARPSTLEKLVRSMMRHMGGASATPGPSAVVSAHVGERSATALLVPQGAWVVDRADERAVIDAVLPGHDRATLWEALRALSHLPAPLLARRIEGLPGTWWPADESRVIESANTSLARTIVRDGKTLQVVFGMGGDRERAELDGIISGWRR